MEDKIKIGGILLKLNDPVVLFHKKLNISFISTYLKKDKKKLLPIFMYYTTLFHVVSSIYSYSQEEVLNINPLNKDKLIHRNSNFSKEMTDFVFTFEKIQPSITFPLSPETKHMIGLLQYSLYTIYFKDSLSIFIHYAKTPIGNEFIKGKLQHIFNAESVTFTSIIDDADVIISDTIEHLSMNIPTFFLEDIYNITLWKGLYAFIQNLLIELYHL